MSVKIGEAYYDITARTDRLEAELSKVQRQMDQQARKQTGMMDSLRTGYLAVAGSVAVFAAAIVKSVNAASRLEEATSKFNTVFGDNVGKASAAVENLTKNYAMSTREARQYMSAVQDLLVPMGMNGELAADFSDEIVRLSADLGSFNDQQTADVMGDIQSALVGNYETMKKYGVVLNEEAVKREAIALGLAKQGETLAQVNKVQAAYSLILKGTKAAQGDMARTLDSYANSVKRLNAAIEETQATIGKDIKEGFGKLINTMMDSEEAGAIMKAAMQDVAKFISSAAVAVAKLIGWIDQLEKKFGVLSRAGEILMKTPIGAMYRYNKMVLDYVASTDEATDATNETTDATKDGAAAVDQYGNALKKLQKERNLDADNTGKQAEAEEKLAKSRQDFIERTSWQMVNTGVGIVSAAADIANNIANAQVQALEQTLERGTVLLDMWKAEQLKAMGFVEETEAQKLDTQITQLKQNIKLEKNLKKKAALQAELADKEHLRKKYTIEQQYELASFALQELMDRKRAAIMRKAAAAQRAAATLGAITNAASAIMAAWSSAFQMQSSGGVWYLGVALGAISTALIGAMLGLQLAAIHSAPMPMAAEGMVSNRPAIFGEAGMEMAVPLAGAQGQKSIALFTAAIIDELNRRGRGDSMNFASAATMPAPATLEVTGGERPFMVSVYLGSKLFYRDIARATSNGELIIDARSVKKI